MAVLAHLNNAGIHQSSWGGQSTVGIIHGDNDGSLLWGETPSFLILLMIDLP